MENPVRQELPELTGRLRKCCLESLRRLYLEDAGILARGVSWDGSEYRVAAPSLIDTANVLVALFAMQRRGVDGPLDADRMLQRCVSEHLEGADFSEVAVLLWADSLGERAQSAMLWAALQQRLPRDASSTMLLSWTLSAVCEYFKVGAERSSARALAGRLYDEIAGNQCSATGLFHSSDRRQGLLRRRSPTAHLPSQVFAMQALAQYSEAFADDEALARASRCADRLCSLQGPEGQWWCVYDVRKGVVAQEYPVYSVHQDGAMPAALTLIARAGGGARFDEARNRGMLWVSGDNELKTPLIDDSRALVLRGMAREGDELKIIREMRAYHPGRCLYALTLTDM